MEFKVGGKYIMRGNPRLPKPTPVTIIEINSVEMVGTLSCINIKFSWNLDGTYPGYSESDLIAEYQEPGDIQITIPNIVPEIVDHNKEYTLFDYAKAYGKPMSSYVKPHTCIPVGTGMRKDWCKICDRDM